ncbi:DC-STAMP domain-containing protein 1 [Operophtera brumata]|uniref:DC-STAMP domain-containing protein 1 n=1 Tax=Operophtera brumata TaxID=104452 RepID=A0A0L7KS60_OPEBR|nr:DC-STAMP domain-containing protein 1 [Operophtera brumata]
MYLCADRPNDLWETRPGGAEGGGVNLHRSRYAIIMHYVITIMNICMALLFLRIFNAAVTYHDLYLTNIDYDNVEVREAGRS